MELSGADSEDLRSCLPESPGGYTCERTLPAHPRGDDPSGRITAENSPVDAEPGRCPKIESRDPAHQSGNLSLYSSLGWREGAKQAGRAHRTPGSKCSSRQHSACLAPNSVRMAPAVSPRQPSDPAGLNAPRRGTGGQSSQLTQLSRARVRDRRAAAAVPGACPAGGGGRARSEQAAGAGFPLHLLSGCRSLPRAPGLSVSLSLSLSLAAAPSGGAHRWAPPLEVSVLRDVEEAEHGSRSHTRPTPGTEPAPSPLAEPLRCALKRGWRRLGSACVLRGLPSHPWTSRDSRALRPFAFGLGWERTVWTSQWAAS